MINPWRYLIVGPQAATIAKPDSIFPGAIAYRVCRAKVRWRCADSVCSHAVNDESLDEGVRPVCADGGDDESAQEK